MSYATEAIIRTRFNLHDAALIPDSLVTALLEDAHDEILRHIDPALVSEPPQYSVWVGEALIAGAKVLRALASNEAFVMKHVTLGGNRLQPAARVEALLRAAGDAEARGWYFLEPVMLTRVPRTIAAATDTQPVLGGE